MQVQQIRKYRRDFLGKIARANEEKKLFADGYIVQVEEVVREWKFGQLFLWLIIFFPLFWLAYVKVVKVTYIKEV